MGRLVACLSELQVDTRCPQKDPVPRLPEHILVAVQQVAVLVAQAPAAHKVQAHHHNLEVTVGANLEGEHNLALADDTQGGVGHMPDFDRLAGYVAAAARIAVVEAVAALPGAGAALEHSHEPEAVQPEPVWSAEVQVPEPLVPVVQPVEALGQRAEGLQQPDTGRLVWRLLLRLALQVAVGTLALRAWEHQPSFQLQHFRLHPWRRKTCQRCP